MAKCEVCGKGVTFGIKVSHSHRRSNRTWKPNVRRVKAVVEGYYATEAGYMLAQKVGIEMPITTAMYELLYENKPVQECIKHLMNRPRKSEIEEIWK